MVTLLPKPRTAVAPVVTPGPLLSLNGVSKRFVTSRHNTTAVQDISFDVFPGEVLGLIGPNGAGKTTLVNMVTGVSRPTRGSITYEGRPLTGLRPYKIGRMGIARTFQVVRPFANLSVLENVAVGAMYGAGGARRSARSAMQRAEEVLEFVQLASRRDDAAESHAFERAKRIVRSDGTNWETQDLRERNRTAAQRSSRRGVPTLRVAE